jgi:pimeloyl-ACP methyl ester carboxylesterase
MSLPLLSTVTLPSGTLAWREAGTGAALLCLHGLGSSSESWKKQYSGFGGAFRIIGWDCPGYGGSDDPPTTTPLAADYAETLVGLLNALSLGKVDLIGHSMGAIVAGCFAGLYSNRVRRLILSGARAGYSRHGAAASGYANRLEELRTLSPEEFGRRRAARMVAPDAAAAVRERTARIAAEARLSGFAAACHMLTHSDNTAALSRLSMPTLIVCGAEDRIAAPEESRHLLSLIPDAELVLIDGAAHAPYAERPDQYNAAIAEFLA